MPAAEQASNFYSSQKIYLIEFHAALSSRDVLHVTCCSIFKFNLLPDLAEKFLFANTNA